MNLKKYLKIIGPILFFYILSKINLRELFLILRNIKFFYFLLALGVRLPAFILGVFKWRKLINAEGIKIDWNNLFIISLKGLYLGTITPGKLGEFWRAKYLAEDSNSSPGRSFYTAFMDRLIDLIILGVVGLAAISLLPLFYQVELGWTAIILVLLLISFTSYFLIKKENIKKILRFLIRTFLPISLRDRTDLFLDEFFNGLKKINPLFFVKLFIYGMGCYFLAVLVYYFLALSLGIIVPYWYFFLIIALIRLISILPITVLGLGVREASYIFFFSVLGIASFQAVAFSLLFLFCNIILAVPGVILSFKKP